MPHRTKAIVKFEFNPFSRTTLNYYYLFCTPSCAAQLLTKQTAYAWKKAFLGDLIQYLLL